MKPTTEQTVCIDYAGTGRKLRINAYAGTGKTSTLKMLARSTQRRGLYLAFNRSIAQEAGREFPRSVSCKTTHGLAFRDMTRRYSEAKMTGNTSAGFLASKLRLSSVQVDRDTTISARGWGFLIGETVKRWQRSGADEIQGYHAPLEGKIALLPPKVQADLRSRLVDQARALWSRMVDPADAIPLGHDGYLKLWALDKPTLPADYILLDEAQDTNGVVLALMRHQPGQIIAVGDRHQQIYEWRGAVNAMVQMPAELEARLSTSFRFGPAIAENATRVLQLLGETVPLRGNPDRASVVGHVDKPNAILTRTNGTLISYVFESVQRGERPHVVGGTQEIMMILDAAEKLQAGQSVEMPLDFFGFKNWGEVRQASDGEDGQELRRWVKLVDDHGVDRLRRTLENLPTNEADADLILSTGHKSKGREWGKVQLADDFLRGVGTGAAAGPALVPAESVAEELRLFYVAVTRGKDAIDIPPALTAKLRLIEPAAAAPEAVQPDLAALAPVAAPIVARPPCDEFEPLDVASILAPAGKAPAPSAPAWPGQDEFEPIGELTAAPFQSTADKTVYATQVGGRGDAPATHQPEKSRQLKCHCLSCGYIAYTTRKWISKLGPPICPGDNEAMVEG